jgi:hypothetical protein
MSLYRGVDEDGSGLEVIITTYPGDPVGEHGERLAQGGVTWTIAGARVARRRDQQTRLDIDPDVPPVETIIIVATSYRGDSVCLVIHRPLDAPAGGSETVARSFALTPASATNEDR